MKRVSLLLFLANMTVVYGQTAPVEYQHWIRKADSLHGVQEYKKSGATYSLAFKSFGWRGYLNDRYNAARSWSLALIPDSAMSNLEKIAIKAKYSDYDQIVSDNEFESLHGTQRWNSLLAKIKENEDEIKKSKDKREINFNRELIKRLDSLVNVDQKLRADLIDYENNNLKKDSTLRSSFIYSLKKADSLHYFQLKVIFQKYGFPNFDLVGEGGSHNFWLLIQHQDRHPQFQEEVLAKMKMEADKGKASNVDYAYLLDRVKVNTNQPQVYGTQLKINSKQSSYEPKQIIDPDKINERRTSIGLGTIEEYIEIMNKRYFGNLKRN